MRTFFNLTLVATLGAFSGPALARAPGGGGYAYGPDMPVTVAEYDQFRGQPQDVAPDRRERMRERWQQLPPDRREAVRDRLRQEWQSMPPEERQQRRQEWLKRLRERGDQQRDDEGYGRGYGNRY